MAEEVFVRRGLLSALDRKLGRAESRKPHLDHDSKLTHLGLVHRTLFMRFLEWIFGGKLEPEFLVSRRERALAMLAASDLHEFIIFNKTTEEGMEAWTWFNEYREKIDSANDGWRAYSVRGIDSEDGCITADPAASERSLMHPRPSAHAERSLLFIAAATRPPPRTKLLDPAAHVVLVLQEPVHATALRPRTLLQAVPSALVVPDLLVSSDDPRQTFEYLQTDTLVDACTCEKASDGGLLPTETDFTTSH
ncbi:hypothetical protein BKA64DRAFT_713467 [Cadophora sp. MPI-SDFR-AT-0126]|nr:hypothetical protein BKA64DRAFT_713467 [Leotiomycetes sp. MPI-SDFR-AT-0126]